MLKKQKRIKHHRKSRYQQPRRNKQQRGNALLILALWMPSKQVTQQVHLSVQNKPGFVQAPGRAQKKNRCFPSSFSPVFGMACEEDMYTSLFTIYLNAHIIARSARQHAIRSERQHDSKSLPLFSNMLPPVCFLHVKPGDCEVERQSKVANNESQSNCGLKRCRCTHLNKMFLYMENG